jgi:tetratricopeptide (TPR) repeat protein/predicted Ser/Thr protein kinase
MSTSGPQDDDTERLARATPFPHTQVGPGPRAENEARLGRRIGPYRLQRLLGHGGMGAVYLARRDDGEFEREVALKLIRSGGEDEASLRRFERERRILSRLEHPAIARLYEGGVEDDGGAPWFAMERIEGENLAAWCASQRLPLRERVRLVVAIGHAVQYAHQQLVIHRDLKPSNILVDAKGAPHVLDFGIAAMLDEDGVDRTSPRTSIHTPEYAAPEQIEGAPVSAATDVYSLAVLLFELLTGARPFDAPNANAFELQRAVLQAPTPALASRIPAAAAERERLAAERASTAPHWRRVLRSDLDAVLQKALEKRPQDRYPTMSSFIDDLQRWLDGRPVQAAHAGLLYRAGKFVRRRRVPLAIVAGVLLLLASAMGVSLHQARKARQEAERAEVVKQFLMSLFQQAKPGSDAALSAQQLLDQGRDRLQREMGDQPRIAGQLLNTIGNAYAHLGDYAQAATQLELALTHLPAEGDTLRARLDVLVDLVDLCSHQHKGLEGEHYAKEALAIVARLRRSEASPIGWLDSNLETEPNYFGDAAQTLDSRAEDLDLARARLLDLRNEREAAIGLRQRVADARDARPGEHPARIRAAQNDLALALTESGRLDEAIVRFQRLLLENERTYGEDHSSSITMRHNLALTLRRANRIDEAEALERGNAALAARVLPPTHPMHAYIANTMAAILRQQSRYAEAQTWYEKARAVFDGQPEADRDMLATVHYNESVNRLALLDLDGARASLLAADGVWSAAYGDAYPRRIALALQQVEIALQSGGAAAMAARIDETAALIAAQVKPDPRDRLKLQLARAQLLRARGEFDAAEAVLAADAAEVATQVPAPTAEQTGWAVLRAQLALDRGDVAAAGTQLERAEAQQAQRRLPPTPEMQLLRARLACASGDAAACMQGATDAERAYTAYLPEAAWPRRLARLWQLLAADCVAPATPPPDPQVSAEIAALAAERPQSAELQALRAACTGAASR